MDMKARPMHIQSVVGSREVSSIIGLKTDQSFIKGAKPPPAPKQEASNKLLAVLLVSVTVS